jgi:hypothetical protein
VRQQPKQARMCGVGGKSSSMLFDSLTDHRPPSGFISRRWPSSHRPTTHHPTPRTIQESKFRRWLFVPAGWSRCFWPAIREQLPAESVLLHVRQPREAGRRWRSALAEGKPVVSSVDEICVHRFGQDGKTCSTTGSVVSSLYHLKDAENGNEDAGFFVFPDLSVRTEGSYRLKLSLFEVVGWAVFPCVFAMLAKPDLWGYRAIFLRSAVIQRW